MARLFLVLGLLIALALGLRWLLRAARRDPGGDNTAADPRQLVRCARCGVHIAEGQALKVGDRHYCCDAHRQADEKSPRA